MSLLYMKVTSTQLRQNIYKLLDEVLSSGVPLEIERNGKILKITGNHKVYTKEYIWKKVEDLSENDEIIDFNFNI